MRLNHDCVRDILLFVEDKTDDEICYVEVNELFESLNYTKNELFYHIRRMSTADLFDSVEYADNEPQLISNLSWTGHQYIDNIRDEKVWKKVKVASNKVASASLPILIEFAAKIVAQSLMN